ncbi:MgtC/SapB family protein [Yoonia vestfoldensis]|jgi:putative Mg2+ transporter-C (MgtC) family protein|uniref:Protein MgtC n=1 Tax=Yoonia vestfoldensis TaxID=245188 RepID=A0A1Y0E9I1_9RHOB|nr:MgtC/SapB family protein [Yoonia vestfoldensis]ARU00264.1 putative Mg(2+) transport ATPase [Yoonia vestfoldensis]
MLHDIGSTIMAEFGDLPDIAAITVITLRLLTAAALGGVLGYDRERKARSAGVRTHMLVAVGAALFVIGPIQAGMPIEQVSRVLQGIVQGIGFLGAGAIIVRRSRHEVEGLTTAASIWATAGIGVIVGLGLEATAILTTAVVLAILVVMPFLVPQCAPGDTDIDDPRS